MRARTRVAMRAEEVRPPWAQYNAADRGARGRGARPPRVQTRSGGLSRARVASQITAAIQHRLPSEMAQIKSEGTKRNPVANEAAETTSPPHQPHPLW